MRFRINVYVLFFVFVILLDPSFAAVNCQPQFFLDFVSGGGCSDSPAPYPSELLPDASCTAEVAEHSCLATVYNVCCELDVVVKYRDDKYTNEIITGVLIGNEADVAQSRFEQWKSSVSLDAPEDGFSLTGSFEGYIYGSDSPVADGTVNLNFSAWKRGFYTRTGSGSGTVTPVENINGSGGSGVGGGLTSQDISGVYNSPYSKGTTFDVSKGYENYGGGLSRIDDHGNSVSVSPYPSGIVPYSNSLISSFGQKSFSQVFSDFKNNIQSTSLFSFYSPAFSVPDSSDSVVSFNAGVYGSHSFDFASWSSLYPYIRALVMVVFSFVAVKIIILKGGS